MDTKNAAVDEIVLDCLAVRVRMIARAVSSLYDHAVAGHGVSIAQVNLLAAIGKLGVCSPIFLGDLLQLERSTVSRNLALLIKNGWVEAVSSDAKGLREVRLTSLGLEKINSVMDDWRTAQDQARKLLGDVAVEAVRGFAINLSSLPST